MSDGGDIEQGGIALGEPRVSLIEGNFSRVRVRAQDIVVISTQAALSHAQRKEISDALLKIFPGNHHLILDEGMTIGALAPVRDEDCEDEDDGHNF